MESFNQKVKRQIFEMLEASEGKYRSNWDIASEALQIVKNMYKVDDAQELAPRRRGGRGRRADDGGVRGRGGHTAGGRAAPGPLLQPWPLRVAGRARRGRLVGAPRGGQCVRAGERHVRGDAAR